MGRSPAYGQSDIGSSVSLPAAIEVSYSNNRGNEVTVSTDAAESSNTLINISSEFGIGSAAIKLKRERWPDSLTIRLHLRGLEGFIVSNGTTTLEKHQLSIQAYDQSMTPFDGEYLMSEAGYYEIRLPKALLTESATDIHINWVDFYR